MLAPRIIRLFALLALFSATALSAQQTRLFQCDRPTSSDPTFQFKDIGGLIVNRPEDPALYRKPRIEITFRRNGGAFVTERYRVQQAIWSPSGTLIRTKLIAASSDPRTFDAITLDYQSSTAFQPLSGKLLAQIGNRTVTISFNTCGVQSTSAYYWTNASKNVNEAFACPTNDMPPGCPGVAFP